MLRTGIFSGACTGPWLHSPPGGSQVTWPLRLYLADKHEMDMAGGSSCNKWRRSTMQLIPGVMLLWCMGCGTCLLFGITPDAESPRTIFNLVYTPLHPPELFMIDNG
jgi:hypothetical protein